MRLLVAQVTCRCPAENTRPAVTAMGRAAPARCRPATESSTARFHGTPEMAVSI